MAKKNAAKVASKVVEPEAKKSSLTVEMVDIDSLSLDPSNARLHNTRNMDAIKASLRRFSQQKPIVVDRNNVVRAGNGTLAAAKALGWKQIAIVRSDLAGSDMTAFAIVDNKSSDLSEWDDDVLAAELGGLREDGFDLDDLGFNEKDLAKLLGDELPESGGDGLADEKFMVVVTCSSESDQADLLARLSGEGLDCKAMAI